MKNCLENFNKKNKFLICIDSDGCAIDTMDIKHRRCFGPTIIKEWNLEKWENEILNKWNEINLYTITRGINRFKGLALVLTIVNEKYKKIDDIDIFIKWVNETNELSNKSLENAIKENNKNICFEKALAWSKEVNKKIKSLSDDEKYPFDGVVEVLKEAKKNADIAIVSSANEQAILDEWSKNGLLKYVDVVLSQNIGSKAYCIGKLIEKGYKNNNVLMIGDALGDYEAAKFNEILYYPILVKKEEESWKKFLTEALEKFITNTYINQYQEELINKFKINLE